MQNISLITTHFYDFDWITCWIDRIRSNTDQELITEILVVNQDRDEKSRKKLARLDNKIKVIEYPLSLSHFDKQGHDHANVLNLVVKEAIGDFICLFDSDCHPINNQWLQNCSKILKDYDAITALDPLAFKRYSLELSHPCFMVLRKLHVSIPLSFDEGLFEYGRDTGRMVANQLTRAGERVYIARPEKAFQNLWGYKYIDSIYHHERGSYSGGDYRLQRQIDWRQSFFKTIVIRNKRYRLNNFESWYYGFRYLKRGRVFKYYSYLCKMLKKYLVKN